MLISIGIDVGARNGAIAIIDEDFKILYLDKAPYYEVEMSKVAANRNKPKLNRETRKYEVTYKKRSWTDYKQLKHIFQSCLFRNKSKSNSIIYTMERVSVRPGEGEISSFIFGNSLGCFQGLSAYLSPIAIYEPTPQQWKREMGVTSDKATSIALAEKLFETNLKDYQKTGKLDDLAEALLLAVYGFKHYSDDNAKVKGK